jgi:23S rRNA (cytosine1962-C5)-methyltransferase
VAYLSARGDDGAVPDDAYAFLDCGDGRRLERFGGLLVDRPAPGAAGPRRAPDRWASAAVYHPGSGWWNADGSALAESAHPVVVDGLTMEARPAAGGQVGLFPEHLANNAWLAGAVRARGDADADGPTAGPPVVLNLFAYTGLATLVAVAAGARAVHVDASRPAVAWARRNAEVAGLADRPVRWIVDDALDFVRREARRGRRYAGLVLDPPTYGHGGRGGRPAWQFDERIVELLDACAGVAGAGAFWLLTTHTPGWEPDRLALTLATATDAAAREIEGLPLRLEAESGAALRLGSAARFDPLRDERR